MVDKPDLDSRAHIKTFVEAFYGRMLEDERLGPIFTDVAEIDLDEHLPIIRRYWEKLLLGERNYARHTMNIHRAIHEQRPFEPEDFRRWLHYFTSTADDCFEGPYTERAKQTAARIAGNMQKYLDVARAPANPKEERTRNN